ncbi:hypothetical protein [Dyella sp.]|jgi:hypothetical protein|uniref:hypothetical protein n=1 Tax=Dyella sp. TaxID=1869338 RepID=UPI002D776701|nr:hypothetical protein [Dyella sp.]HET6431748.1 hypothetical protein [Dyella sp.]
MSMRTFAIACVLAASSTAFAQSVPAPAANPSDRWSPPPPAAASSASADYRDGAGLKPAAPSHFKFKESRDPHPQRNAAREASGKAAVMGGNEIGRDGRPTVNCPQTPMDPACR